jgi:hypothetical protein
MGSGCIHSSILDLGTSWSGQIYAPAALTPAKKSLISIGYEGGGPRAGLKDMKKTKLFPEVT